MLIWLNSPQTVCEHFIFLDRDGVINEDRPDYVKNISEFRFYPDVPGALRLLKHSNVGVILISNQSGLNRGLIPWNDFWTLHEWVIRAVNQAGGEILAAFYCPHRPDERCSCRKPSPEMIREAASIYRIPLESSFMIGDRTKDILAGVRAGCRTIFLDRHGTGMESNEPELAGQPVPVHRSLHEAVRAVLEDWEENI